MMASRKPKKDQLLLGPLHGPAATEMLPLAYNGGIKIGISYTMYSVCEGLTDIVVVRKGHTRNFQQGFAHERRIPRSPQVGLVRLFYIS